MANKKKTAPITRKREKSSRSITTTSVAFKTDNLKALKDHDMHKKNDLSVSWIINKLVEKFREGDITIN